MSQLWNANASLKVIRRDFENINSGVEGIRSRMDDLSKRGAEVEGTVRDVRDGVKELNERAYTITNDIRLVRQDIESIMEKQNSLAALLSERKYQS